MVRKVAKMANAQTTKMIKYSCGIPKINSRLPNKRSKGKLKHNTQIIEMKASLADFSFCIGSQIIALKVSLIYSEV